jgi:hypothetical protein
MHAVLDCTHGRKTAKLMPEGSKHPSWTDSDLDGRLTPQLGDSGGACKTLIDLIEETLRAVEEEAENFGLTIQKSTPVSWLSLHLSSTF